jgi:hypothetical protein
MCSCGRGRDGNVTVCWGDGEVQRADDGNVTCRGCRSMIHFRLIASLISKSEPERPPRVPSLGEVRSCDPVDMIGSC